MGNTKLVVLSVADERSARDLASLLSEIDRRDENVSIVDSAIAMKDYRGKPQIVQLQQAAETRSGGFGNVFGGLASVFRDTGIDENILRKKAQMMEPGQVVLFVLYSGTWDKSRRALRHALNTFGISFAGSQPQITPSTSSMYSHAPARPTTERQKRVQPDTSDVYSRPQQDDDSQTGFAEEKYHTSEAWPAFEEEASWADEDPYFGDDTIDFAATESGTQEDAPEPNAFDSESPEGDSYSAETGVAFDAEAEADHALDEPFLVGAAAEDDSDIHSSADEQIADEQTAKVHDPDNLPEDELAPDPFTDEAPWDEEPEDILDESESVLEANAETSQNIDDVEQVFESEETVAEETTGEEALTEPDTMLSGDFEDTVPTADEDWLIEEVTRYDAIAEASRAALIAAAAQQMHALDVENVGEILEEVGDTVEEAGEVDIEQGDELLESADEVAEVSAQIRIRGLEQRADGLELGSIAGELSQISHEVREQEMAILSAILGARGERLQALAAEMVASSATARELASLLDETGELVRDLGDDEIEEGVARLAFAQKLTAKAAKKANAELRLDE